MIKGVKVFTRFEWRRLWAPLIVLVLAISLIGGVEAFVPVVELDSLDDVVSIDAVIAPEQETERVEAVDRIGGERVAIRHSSSTSGDVLLTASIASAVGQVDFLLRDGGIQRAARPTGPPSA
jgi:hypothetical protein